MLVHTLCFSVSNTSALLKTLLPFIFSQFILDCLSHPCMHSGIFLLFKVQLNNQLLIFLVKIIACSVLLKYLFPHLFQYILQYSWLAFYLLDCKLLQVRDELFVLVQVTGPAQYFVHTTAQYMLICNKWIIYVQSRQLLSTACINKL